MPKKHNQQPEDPRITEITFLLDSEKDMRSDSQFLKHLPSQTPKKPWYSFFCCCSTPEEPDSPSSQLKGRYSPIPSTPSK